MRATASYVLPGFLCAAAVAGCGGGNMGSVEGRVTLDGQPLAGAVVQFQPKGGGRPSVAVTDEDGCYELQFTDRKGGALAGEHLVRISTARETEDEQGNRVFVAERVPAKYNMYSELVRQVESGSNEINFELDMQGPVLDPHQGGGDLPESPDDC